jgi:hypothetical protein
MDPQVRQGLRLVAGQGQPAQAAQARRLLEALESSSNDAESSPSDPASEAAARDLVDAYLNDPYLTR